MASATTARDVIEASATGNQDARSSQKQIDALSDDIDALAAEYRAALQATRALDVYNRQLETLVGAQGEEAASLQRQIENVTVVGRQVLPLMMRMLEALEQFVELDVPFLMEERHGRIADLRAMMERADVTISEKYRRVLEAYQIENEYGRTIEAYRGPLDVDGSTITVEFLRIGRIALLYQTLDGTRQGAWDPVGETWSPLADSYRGPIRDGLRMARKQVAPDLITVPVAAAKVLE
jgi:hypothetical protein